MYDFTVNDCTQKQNGSPYYSFIIRQCKRLSPSRKIVEIQKFCFHSNVTSHFSSCPSYFILPIKCFVSHRPPSREGGSVGRAKKKKKEWTHDCILNLTFSLQDIIRWYKMYINRTIKCPKRLQKRSIDDNLRQLVLIRQDRVLVN